MEAVVGFESPLVPGNRRQHHDEMKHHQQQPIPTTKIATSSLLTNGGGTEMLNNVSVLLPSNDTSNQSNLENNNIVENNNNNDNYNDDDDNDNDNNTNKVNALDLNGTKPVNHEFSIVHKPPTNEENTKTTKYEHDEKNIIISQDKIPTTMTTLNEIISSTPESRLAHHHSPSHLLTSTNAKQQASKSPTSTPTKIPIISKIINNNNNSISQQASSSTDINKIHNLTTTTTTTPDHKYQEYKKDLELLAKEAQDSRQRIRRLQSEVEEKNEIISLLKDELELTKEQNDKLERDSRQLSLEVKKFQTLQDEYDELKNHQQETNKLEQECASLKEKLTELEFLRLRVVELEDDRKQAQEESGHFERQLVEANERFAHLGELERELAKCQTKALNLETERDSLQAKLLTSINRETRLQSNNKQAEEEIKRLKALVRHYEDKRDEEEANNSLIMSVADLKQLQQQSDCPPPSIRTLSSQSDQQEQQIQDETQSKHDQNEVCPGDSLLGNNFCNNNNNNIIMNCLSSLEHNNSIKFELDKQLEIELNQEKEQLKKQINEQDDKIANLTKLNENLNHQLETNKILITNLRQDLACEKTVANKLNKGYALVSKQIKSLDESYLHDNNSTTIHQLNNSKHEEDKKLSSLVEREVDHDDKGDDHIDDDDVDEHEDEQDNNGNEDVVEEDDYSEKEKEDEEKNKEEKANHSSPKINCSTQNNNDNITRINPPPDNVQRITNGIPKLSEQELAKLHQQHYLHHLQQMHQLHQMHHHQLHMHLQHHHRVEHQNQHQNHINGIQRILNNNNNNPNNIKDNPSSIYGNVGSEFVIEQQHQRQYTNNIYSNIKLSHPNFDTSNSSYQNINHSSNNPRVGPPAIPPKLILPSSTKQPICHSTNQHHHQYNSQNHGGTTTAHSHYGTLPQIAEVNGLPTVNESSSCVNNCNTRLIHKTNACQQHNQLHQQSEVVLKSCRSPAGSPTSSASSSSSSASSSSQASNCSVSSSPMSNLSPSSSSSMNSLSHHASHQLTRSSSARHTMTGGEMSLLAPRQFRVDTDLNAMNAPRPLNACLTHTGNNNNLAALKFGQRRFLQQSHQHTPNPLNNQQQHLIQHQQQVVNQTTPAIVSSNPNAQIDAFTQRLNNLKLNQGMAFSSLRAPKRTNIRLVSASPATGSFQQNVSSRRQSLENTNQLGSLGNHQQQHRSKRAHSTTPDRRRTSHALGNGNDTTVSSASTVAGSNKSSLWFEYGCV